VGVAGCGGGRYVDVVKDFDDELWLYSDSLTVSFTAPSPPAPVRMILSYGLTDEYPYRNLTLKTRVSTPKGKSYESMPIFVVADALGNWRTEPQWDGGHVFFDTVYKNTVFDPPGEYRFDFKHYHRTDTLKGVKFFRVIVE
jgi:hypothetical protein